MFSRILKLQIMNCLFAIGFFINLYWHFLIYFDSQIKNHLELIKTNSKFGEKKSGFVVSGFVKTCDELVISWENGYLFISSSARILIIFYTFLISLSDEL